MEKIFLTVDEFKKIHGIACIKIKRNPQTDKLFCELNIGGIMKCQQTLDMTKPMSIICDDDPTVIDNCCLINVTSTETIGSI